MKCLEWVYPQRQKIGLWLPGAGSRQNEEQLNMEWVCISFGGEWKCSKIRQCRWLYNFVNTPKPTELYTLKRWILLCVNYISLKLLFFKRHFKMFDFLQWWDPLTILFTSFLVLDLKSAIANTLRLNSFRDFTLSEDDLAWHLGLQILQHFSHCYLWN